jgi:hypothetical protein
MNKKVKRFEDLEVWKKAHKLVLDTYRITRDFPFLQHQSEFFGRIEVLSYSIRRSWIFKRQ